MAAHRTLGLVQALSLFLALVSSASANLNGTTRTYYVAAVEEEWDYMPRYVAAGWRMTVV